MSKAFSAFDKSRLPNPNRPKKTRNDPRYLPGTTSAVSSIHFKAVKYRSNIREEYIGIENLAESIHQKGLLEPVRLTQDEYLIFGYRRIKAIEYGYNNIENFNRNLFTAIPCTIDERRSSEIDQEEWEKLQLAENEERQELDNFDLARLYQRKINRGWTRKKLQEYFNISRGFVSNILKLNNILPELKTYCKEFQEYGWSKSMYTAVYNSGMSEKEQDFYENNRGIIGWKTLYAIAKHDSQEEQIKVFLHKFHPRLTKKELTSELFLSYVKTNNHFSPSLSVQEKIEKGVKSLETTLTKIQKHVCKIEAENPQEALEFVDYTIDRLQGELNKFLQIKTEMSSRTFQTTKASLTDPFSKDSGLSIPPAGENLPDRAD